jgi:serine O-acetyltransferase
MKEDYRAHRRSIFLPGFHAVATHRLGVWGGGIRNPVGRKLVLFIYGVLNLFVRNVYGIELHASTTLGRRVRIAHQSGIVIHSDAVLGDGCMIRQNVTIGVATGSNPKVPILGQRVQVGAGAVLIGGIVIGDDATIGPNAVVMTNVPAGSIVAAPPARVMVPPPTRKSVKPEAADLATAGGSAADPEIEEKRPSATGG